MLYVKLRKEAGVKTMNETDCMNILVTLDANYILPLRVLLYSMLRADPAARYAVYVAHSSLTDMDFSRIRKGIECSRLAVIPLAVPPELLADAPVLKRLTKASYYRLIAPSFLPQDVERILYLDPDITVLRSLRPFYNTDLKGHYIAAAGHMEGILRRFNLRRLGIRHNADYVNSGVLLMDVTKLRALDNNEEIFAFVRDNARRLLLGDQDTVNAFYDGHILCVDTLRYNLDEKVYARCRTHGTIDKDWVRDHTVIVHYDGADKPWKPPYKGRLGAFFFRMQRELEASAGETV